MGTGQPNAYTSHRFSLVQIFLDSKLLHDPLFSPPNGVTAAVSLGHSNGTPRRIVNPGCVNFHSQMGAAGDLDRDTTIGKRKNSLNMIGVRNMH